MNFINESEINGVYICFFDQNHDVDNEDTEIDYEINSKSAEVYNLVKQLPAQNAFNIFIDNYFSSVNLFNFLREKEYGACGTSLPIPKVVNNYNIYIGAVDIADQLHMALVNSYIISKSLALCNELKTFKLELVRILIKDAAVNPLKCTMRSEEQNLPEKKAENKKESLSVVLVFAKKNDELALQNLPQSHLWCSKYDVALCYNKERSCFRDFHTLKD
ncbi:16905_t:CDS:2 [Cetraspora pellucida]|uniref:16905_t:CDS:1 n=1 Tax=Cetraspora pellucida TaxID=1433469 RepID=A0A9N9CVA2_9GLOM|nr:16905_t:CDS:2 [Cetraspora pellucida]